jgi:hypothetical protein
MNIAEAKKGRPLQQTIKRWNGVSRRIEEPHLKALGYSRCIEKDIEEHELMLPEQYDALILLHTLEHLDKPEETVERSVSFCQSRSHCDRRVPKRPRGSET